MKRALIWVSTALLAGGLSLAAQVGSGGGPGPRAACDKDGDGKCDICGRPVGQMRGPGAGPRARGGMRQRGCCRRAMMQGQGQNQNQPQPVKPSTPPAAKP